MLPRSPCAHTHTHTHTHIYIYISKITLFRSWMSTWPRVLELLAPFILINLPYKVKVKWSRYRPGVAQGVGRGIALLNHDRGTRRGEWSAARPGRSLPPEKTRYPFYRRLGGPQGRSERAENLVPIGILSRIIQPLVSRYTDWAIYIVIITLFRTMSTWPQVLELLVPFISIYHITDVIFINEVPS